MTTHDRSPKTIRLVTAVLLLATFAAGAASGAALLFWFEARSERFVHRPPIGGPWHELNLTSAQRDKMRAIMEGYRPQLDAILNETFPKVRAINEQIDQDIRKILTPEQQRQFDQIKQTRDRHDRPRPHPGPPGAWAPGGPGPHMDMPFGPPPER